MVLKRRKNQVVVMKRIALCIGNDEYSKMQPLCCAINDATCMSESLKELGFDTICRCKLDRAEMVNVISDYVDRIAEYDLALFYYAGHGCQIEGENILAPTDLDVNQKPASIKYNAFALEDLMRWLDNYPDTVLCSFWGQHFVNRKITLRWKKKNCWSENQMPDHLSNSLEHSQIGVIGIPTEKHI